MGQWIELIELATCLCCCACGVFLSLVIGIFGPMQQTIQQDKSTYIPSWKEAEFFENYSEDTYVEKDGYILVKDNYTSVNPAKCWKFQNRTKDEVLSSLIFQGMYPTFNQLTIYDTDKTNSLTIKNTDRGLSVTDLLELLKTTALDLSYLDDNVMYLMADPEKPLNYYWLTRDEVIKTVENMSGTKNVSFSNRTQEKTYLLENYIIPYVSNGKINDSLIAGSNIIVIRNLIRSAVKRYLEICDDSERTQLYEMYGIGFGWE